MRPTIGTIIDGLRRWPTMANEEQLAVLREGSDVWNAWRAKNRRVRVDLAGAYLRNAGLFEANLSRTRLSRAILWDANLFGARLVGADLTEASLFGTSLIEANLSTRIPQMG
jgi:uncharacterized protein YjbI with pentapeptide repeats